MNIFLLRELLRTLLVRWRTLLWGVSAIVLSAISFCIVAVLMVASGEWGENRLIVLFDRGVSSEQIRQLYRQVRQWEAISEVFYIPQGDPRFAQDGIEPERAPAGYLRVTVRQGSDIREAEAALRDSAGVAAVQSYRKGALRALLTSDSGAKAVATGVEIGSLLVSLVALGMLIRVLSSTWRGELEILYLSGLPPRTIRGTFWGVAVLCALVAAFLAISALALAGASSEARFWLPELQQPAVFGQMSVWIVGLGVLVGAGAGLVGAWTVRVKYPASGHPETGDV